MFSTRSSLSVVICVALLLAGCGEREAQAPSNTAIDSAVAPDDQPAPVDPVATPSPVEIDPVESVLSAVADQVIVRYDRMSEDGVERQVFMEVLSGSLSDAEDKIAVALETGGYVRGHRMEDENGARQLYRARSDKPVRTLVRARGVGPQLSNSEAIGSVYLRF